MWISGGQNFKTGSCVVRQIFDRIPHKILKTNKIKREN